MKTLKILSLTLMMLSGFMFKSFAEEGMWIPTLLKMLNEDDMKTYGLKLTAEDIYSINNSSLKDAIVHFNGGCTAEIISNDGLILTNHHCGYGQIQAHSSVENDYLTDGFWAMDKQSELRNEGLTATLIIRIEDVTDKVLVGLKENMDSKNKRDVIKDNNKDIIKNATKGNQYDAVIKPFYFGNKYYMFVTETFKDVRLVGAPPSSIGKFGGDTDNWMWPRHTGDFSMFRIYANENNRPNSFSWSNIPYKPKHHLPINLKGVEEGDFTMVYGFPGRTTQYLTSYAVDFLINHNNPTRIGMREVGLDIMEHHMSQSDKVRIQYAAKYARISNYHKKWIGENRGLHKLNAIDKKEDLENRFMAIVNSSEESKAKYGHLMSDFETLYAQREELALAMAYFVEFIYYGPDLIYHMSKYRSLAKETMSYSVDLEEVKKGVVSLKSRNELFFKNMDMDTEKKLFESLLKMYHQHVDSAMKGESFSVLETKFKGDYTAFTEDFYNKTIFIDKEATIDLLNDFNTKTAKKIMKDPAYHFMDNLMNHYYKFLKPEIGKIDDKIKILSKLYVEGLQELMPNERKYYPDANGTLRLTYGKVEGYSPMDGVEYDFYTTMDGVMGKYNPDVGEFDLPKKLVELYDQKDYGMYGKDGELRVCFTASNHTTGGNSGSPVLDENGYLIGLNFDRTWESTMSDVMFDPDRCRNIAVDIRYVLFVVDKFAGASHLVEEMTLITRESEIKDEIKVLDLKIDEKTEIDSLYNSRALLYFELKQLDKAFIDFNKASEISPNMAKFHYNMGTVKALENDWNEAVNYFSKTIQLDPLYVDAYYNRGKVYAEQGMFTEAIIDFTSAVRYKPDHSAAYHNRGIAKNIMTDSKDGCLDIRKAMELGSKRAYRTYTSWCE
jgi:tetratricopeptide (TPR) repeat protein